MEQKSDIKDEKYPVKRHSFQVTARDIKRFAQAIGDQNPLYYDEEYAKTTPYKTIVAPPLFCQAITFEDVPLNELPTDLSPSELNVDVPATRAVGGSSQYDFYQFIRTGDTITAISNVLSIEKKQGKNGSLYLVSVETLFKNQFNERVAKEVAIYVKK